MKIDFIIREIYKDENESEEERKKAFEKKLIEIIKAELSNRIST